MPPYTGTAAPWINLASSLHKNRITRAISSGFGSNNLVERSALPFESRHLLADGHEQVAVEGELRLVANLTVSWDDDRLVRDFGLSGAT
ncbi:MAG: hypothetical protein LAN70_14725 [Acidobacteriia bacterium]|nr:hypothetical protein [Terriglobia bacterium]